MNKAEFVEALKNGLSGLPQEDTEARISFYSEMIDDRIEEGIGEEEAVAAMGPIDRIVSQIVSEIPMKKLVKEKMTPKRKMRSWETVLIVLGFPLWFPLIIAAACVLFSLYVVLWSLIVALWAVEISLAASLPAAIISAIVQGSMNDNAPFTLGIIGVCLILAGLSILLCFPCISASKGMVRLTKELTIKIKRMFIRG